MTWPHQSTFSLGSMSWRFFSAFCDLIVKCQKWTHPRWYSSCPTSLFFTSNPPILFLCSWHQVLLVGQSPKRRLNWVLLWVCNPRVWRHFRGCFWQQGILLKMCESAEIEANALVVHFPPTKNSKCFSPFRKLSQWGAPVKMKSPIIWRGNIVWVEYFLFLALISSTFNSTPKKSTPHVTMVWYIVP